MTAELAEATAEDLETVERLLERYDLPTDDVGADAATFYLLRDHGELVGVGGLEIAGSAGLLRSVAVTAPGEGNGRTLCNALEDRARDRGADALYLLTETAAGFFERLGYGRLDRASAPAGIRATREFSELCGDTEVCLWKPL